MPFGYRRGVHKSISFAIIGEKGMCDMSLAKTLYEHIALDPKGIPIIGGTTMKVIELVAEKLAHGWSAEELLFQHPYLTLGQIYSALAYYADHREALEKEIEERLEASVKLQREVAVPPLIERLKSRGLV
jgi:uncharacterized protein (DUF433 family)